MATHIIIDGYNLIGVKTGLRGDIESRRRELIGLLSRYKNIKGTPLLWSSMAGREGRQWKGGTKLME